MSYQKFQSYLLHEPSKVCTKFWFWTKFWTKFAKASLFRSACEHWHHH